MNRRNVLGMAGTAGMAAVFPVDAQVATLANAIDPATVNREIAETYITSVWGDGAIHRLPEMLPSDADIESIGGRIADARTRLAQQRPSAAFVIDRVVGDAGAAVVRGRIDAVPFFVELLVRDRVIIGRTSLVADPLSWLAL